MMFRMKLLCAVFLVATCLVATKVAAQDPSSAPAAPSISLSVLSTLDTNKDGKVDQAEVEAMIAKDPKAADVVQDVLGTMKAVEVAKSDWQKAKMIAVATVLAMVFKLLLSLLKVISTTSPWFSTTRGKNVIKYSTIGLGCLAGLFGSLALGVSPMDALMLAVSGPVSVAIHEYLNPVATAPAPTPPAA